MPPRRAAKPAITPTPLTGCIAISGSIPSYTQAAVKSLIEKLGASVASKVNDDTTHLVTTPFDLEKNTTKVKDAMKRGIPIVEVSWLEECDSTKTRVKEDAHVVGQSAQNGAASQVRPPAATPAPVVMTDSTVEDADSSTLFKGCVIALAGRLTRSQRRVGDLIQEYGGDVVKAVDTESATHLITTQAALESNGAEIQAAKKNNIPILAEDWIDDSVMAHNTEIHTKHLLDPSQARSVISPRATKPAVTQELDLFQDCIIVVSGSVPDRCQKDAVALIKEYGGESPAGVPKFMTHLVTTEAEIEKKTAKVRAALDDPDIHIVSFDWLDYCINMMQKSGESHHNLRPGSQTKKRNASPDTAQVALSKRQKVVSEDGEAPQADAEDEPADGQSGSRPGTKRQIPDVKPPGRDSYEVYEDNGVKYDVVLTNCDRYYRIQLLHETRMAVICQTHGSGCSCPLAIIHSGDVWLQWAQFGAKPNTDLWGGGWHNYNHKYTTFGDAMKRFKQKFREKSGLAWEKRFETPKADKYGLDEDIEFVDADDVDDVKTDVKRDTKTPVTTVVTSAATSAITSVSTSASKQDTKKNAKKDGQKVLSIPHDEGVNLPATYQVFIDKSGVIYDASLNQTNSGKNNNKFYRIQILHNATTDHSVTWTRWGRVGDFGQSAKLGNGTLADAIKNYEKKFKDKSGLKWEDRMNDPKPGKYAYLERNYEDSDSEEEDDAKKAAPVKRRSMSVSELPPSKLDPAVQDVVKLIFNQDFINNAMADLNYDANKLPLGKLSKTTINRGYQALKNLAEVLDDATKAAQYDMSPAAAIEHLSNLYFSLIPHNFGRNRAPVINNNTLLKREIELLESLGEMKDAAQIMKVKKEDLDENPLDTQFKGLGLDEMTPLKEETKEFKELRDYLSESVGQTHGVAYEIQDIFRIDRQGELERFKNEFGDVPQDRRLLWHGSRTTNFAGILSQGLRIAPPEAPVSGYMFGKGVYLADMSSKSAGYCCHYSSNGQALLLLCEAELGKPMQELTNASYEAGETAKKQGMLSTFGMGQTGPSKWKDAGAVHKSLKGVKMPDMKVKPGPTNVDNANLYYNEYIVYDVTQVRLRYLLRVKM